MNAGQSGGENSPLVAELGFKACSKTDICKRENRSPHGNGESNESSHSMETQCTNEAQATGYWGLEASSQWPGGGGGRVISHPNG